MAANLEIKKSFMSLMAKPREKMYLIINKRTLMHGEITGKKEHESLFVLPKRLFSLLEGVSFIYPVEILKNKKYSVLSLQGLIHNEYGEQIKEKEMYNTYTNNSNVINNNNLLKMYNNIFMDSTPQPQNEKKKNDILFLDFIRITTLKMIRQNITFQNRNECIFTHSLPLTSIEYVFYDKKAINNENLHLLENLPNITLIEKKSIPNIFRTWNTLKEWNNDEIHYEYI